MPSGSTYDLKDAFLREKFPISITDGGTGKTTAPEAYWNLENRGYAANANAALEVGLYNTNTNTTNLPELAYNQNNGCGVLIVYVSNSHIHNNTNNWIWQLWYNTSTLDQYIRRKVNTSGWSKWTTQEITVPYYEQGTTHIGMRPLVAYARANRLAFLPADQIIIEQTTDGGETWVDSGRTDAQKKALFATRGGSIPIPLLNGEKSTLCGVRITITGMKYNVPENTPEIEKYNYWNQNYVRSNERYCNLREMWFWLNANNDPIRCQVFRATGANPDNWLTCFDIDAPLTGWSGSDWIRWDSNWVFGGGTGQTGNCWNWRIIFWSRMQDGKTAFNSNSGQSIIGINGYGDNVWIASNGLMREDHLYNWDYDMNVAFPARVQAVRFNGIGTDLTQLNGSNITSGTVAEARIAALPASKITSGTFDVARIPALIADKITSGTFNADRIPSLGAAKITSGTFDADRIPNLDASKITSGTFAVERIPDLNASKITDGTLSSDRLPTSGVTAGSYGPSGNQSPSHGGTFSVPSITADAKGRVTSASTKTVTLPTYATATSSANGLMSATDKSKLDSMTTVPLASGLNMTEGTDGLIFTYVN